jgi:WXG100 family type VII secretion target
MLTAAHRMGDAAKKVEAERQDVVNAVTRLFGTFTGGAATGYGTAMRNWYGNVDAIIAELNRMIQVMNTGAELVGQGDRDSTDLSDGMVNQIGGLAPAGLPGL